MVIITTKQYKKDRAFMYGMVGTAGALGVAGTTFGITALVKASKVKSDVDSFHTDMDRRICAEEGMSKQFCKTISQIQDVLEKNEMLRVKK